MPLVDPNHDCFAPLDTIVQIEESKSRERKWSKGRREYRNGERERKTETQAKRAFCAFKNETVAEKTAFNLFQP